MNCKTSYIYIGLALFTVLSVSCGDNERKGGRTDTYSSGVINFTSDESFSPFIEEERELFEYTYKNATLNPVYTNESEAVNMLLRGETCLAITARDYTDAERQNLRDRTFNPQSFPIAYDGFALIVNKENNDTCISVKNIKDIFNGEVTKWSDIYPNSRNDEITVVFDNEKSSTVHYAVDSILGGKTFANPNVVAVDSTADVISYVERTPNAIGIIGSNWLNDKRDTTNLTFNKDIRVMSVSRIDVATPANSWKPYQYYLYNGNYPLVRTIYVLLNDPLRGLPWGFSHFIASQKGQLLILKAGLLPAYGTLTIRDMDVGK